MNTEKDDATEYRVVWWSRKHERWFEHAGHTTKPDIARAWLTQAPYREWPAPTEARIESRLVEPWTSTDLGADL